MGSADQNPNQITGLLKEWSEGKREALDELMPVIYDELRRQAAGYLRRERSDHTLQTTALINEAYLRLAGQNTQWQSRAHFFAIAAESMRRILVDYARNRNRDKRGGGAVKIELNEAMVSAANEQAVDIEALDQALSRLAEFDQRQARIIELRYFAGLSEKETAEVLGISPSTVRLDWKMARAWLRGQLE